MELSEQDIERIIHDATLSMSLDLEQIRETLSEVDSALGWLVGIRQRGGLCDCVKADSIAYADCRLTAGY